MDFDVAEANAAAMAHARLHHRIAGTSGRQLPIGEDKKADALALKSPVAVKILKECVKGDLFHVLQSIGRVLKCAQALPAEDRNSFRQNTDIMLETEIDAEFQAAVDSILSLDHRKVTFWLSWWLQGDTPGKIFPSKMSSALKAKNPPRTSLSEPVNSSEQKLATGRYLSIVTAISNSYDNVNYTRQLNKAVQSGAVWSKRKKRKCRAAHRRKPSSRSVPPDLASHLSSSSAHGCTRTNAQKPEGKYPCLLWKLKGESACYGFHWYKQAAASNRHMTSSHAIALRRGDIKLYTQKQETTAPAVRKSPSCASSDEDEEDEEEDEEDEEDDERRVRRCRYDDDDEDEEEEEDEDDDVEDDENHETKEGEGEEEEEHQSSGQSVYVNGDSVALHCVDERRRDVVWYGVLKGSKGQQRQVQFLDNVRRDNHPIDYAGCYKLYQGNPAFVDEEDILGQVNWIPCPSQKNLSFILETINLTSSLLCSTGN